MLIRAIPDRTVLERTVERIRGAARSFKIRETRAQRQLLASTVPRRRVIEHLIDETSGYGLITPGLIGGVEAAIDFAQNVRNEKRQASKKKQDYNPTILEAKRYEDAPPFFDLALCDDIIQIASEYLGEIPVLYSIKLWHTPAGTDKSPKGSQLYHRDGSRWLLRRAKFLINMSDVDEECGPFTFLPADISHRVSSALGSMKNQDHIGDEVVYRFAGPEDAVAMTGPAGSGAAIDSSRCFHYGARNRVGERLMLQFQFLRLVDAVEGGTVRRSAGFFERFGNNIVRKLIIPRDGSDYHEN